jgi:hypothetical protein
MSLYVGWKGREKLKGKIIALALVLLFAHGGNVILAMAKCGQPVGKAAGAIVSLSPMQTYMDSSRLCTLQVYVHPTGDSLACMECKVTFDASLVDLVAVKEGKLFKESGHPTFLDWHPIPPDTGYVIDCVLGYQTYFLSPGELAAYIFEARAPGVCPVRITWMKMWDIDRIELPVTIDPSAWIFIDSPSGVTPPHVPCANLKSYPNPFSSSVTLTLENLVLRSAQGGGTEVSVRIYSASGHYIATAFEEPTAGDRLQAVWDGRDQRGRVVPSGTYFAVAKTERQVFRTKLVLIR